MATLGAERGHRVRRLPFECELLKETNQVLHEEFKGSESVAESNLSLSGAVGSAKSHEMDRGPNPTEEEASKPRVGGPSTPGLLVRFGTAS